MAKASSGLPPLLKKTAHLSSKGGGVSDSLSKKALSKARSSGIKPVKKELPCKSPNRASTLPKDLNKALPLKLPRILKGLKVRALKVPEYGLMQVCTHISRLDIDSGVVGTHGWQVKLPKHPHINTRFFSDSAQNKRGPQRPSAQRSLKQAVEFLAEHLPQCGE